MRKIFAAACLVASAASGFVMAAAPPLSVKKSVTIAAPADKVWDVVKDFDGWTHWHPALASDEIVSGTNNTVGAVRLLTLKGGGTIKEKLLEYNAAGHRYRYSILESVLPVSNYSSSIVVSATGTNKTLVTWSGQFKRKDPSASPPDNANDQTAVDTITGVYQAGLDNLKKVVEAK
jgi:mxaD protein